MKKKLIIMIGAGLLSFGGMFAFAWLTGGSPASTEAKESAGSISQASPNLPSAGAIARIPGAPTDAQIKKSLTERKLKSLVVEVRQRVQEYQSKLERLNVREQRLQTAHGELRKEVEELNNLRVELAATIASLKDERDKLEKSRVKIAKDEKTNLISMAAAYDKMDPAMASTILTNMSKAQTGLGGTSDAVKILHYMGDRTKANLLAELANTEPTVAAYFCLKLKQMVEE